MEGQGVSLKQYNTFSIDVFAKALHVVTDVDQIKEIYKDIVKNNEPYIIIGEGSNILFTDNFKGTVIVNRIKGIKVIEDNDSYVIHVGSGVQWHDLVTYTLANQMPGLENLALIPGTVGAAPVQNISAYGVELKEHFCYVDVLDLHTSNIKRLNANECQFRYRHSIFKSELKYGHVIVAVGFKLQKEWRPRLEYGSLKNDLKIFVDEGNLTPELIFDAVCRIRRSTLPDPNVIGNAGSFFKNPIVSADTASNIKRKYPSIPTYELGDQVKLSAGWLIEHSVGKGTSIGGAVVYDKHALVIANKGNATSKDVIQLAAFILNKVAAKFQVDLEPEVRFIGVSGEVDAVAVLSNVTM